VTDHLTEIIIAAAIFVIVSVMGFFAARWRRPQNMAHLNEWGLGGRNFGSWITWFLVGGDLYTAYTFVAVPAASSPCRTPSSSTRWCSSYCCGSGRSRTGTAS
jgi:hypothetical protein